MLDKHQIIHLFDSDGDGLVSPQEFKQALQAANIGTAHALARMLAMMRVHDKLVSAPLPPGRIRATWPSGLPETRTWRLNPERTITTRLLLPALRAARNANQRDSACH